MAANPKFVRCLTHTSRMLRRLAVSAGEQRTSEYTQQIAEYREIWSELGADGRTAVVKAAGEIADLTPELIAAAVAALEA
jgi:hypothetical protein